mmetsp:Transcript_7457/g.21829  ORF Transcript_7457/g.21829 Transcript_7457/m.21829 type:complete len:346 (-) Transcript_7457:64-1101(-)
MTLTDPHDATATPSKKAPSGRMVRFDANKTQVHPVPSRAELNMEDFENMWFLKDDYQRMNSWIRLTLNQMRQGLPEENDLCYRGLEHRVNREARDRYHSVLSGSIHAVLQEQDRQWRVSLGIDRPEDIASVYRGFSIASQLEGYQRGKQDERVVKEHQQEDEEEAARRQQAQQQDRPHGKARRRNSFLMEAEDVDYVPPSSCHHLDCFTSDQEFNSQSLTVGQQSKDNSASAKNAARMESMMSNPHSSNDDDNTASTNNSNSNRPTSSKRDKIIGPPKRTLSGTTPRQIFNTFKQTLDLSAHKLQRSSTTSEGKSRFKFRLPSTAGVRFRASSSSFRSSNRRPSL